ncbi:MAG: TolC family protein [Deltaproteobacteria bacterium]|nr:MAG: TolC family protein [Deltaproteobacteria bacterium]
MKKGRPYFTLLFLLLITLSIPGTASSLTLEEAISAALEKNPSVLRAESEVTSEKFRLEASRGKFFPSLDLTYTFSREEEDIFFTSPESSSFTAEASLNLFRGFEDLHTLRGRKYSLQSARSSREEEASRVRFRVIEAFLSALREKQEVEVAEEAVKLLERQRKDAENLLKNGLVPKNDLLKVEVELATARQELLARRASLANSLKRLSLETGLSVENAEILVPPKISFPRDLDGSCLEKEAVAGKNLLKSIEARILSLKEEGEALRGGFFPSVDLSLSYTTYGDSAFPDGRGDSILPDRQLTESLTVTWNIFSGGSTRNELKAKLAEAKALEHRLDEEINFLAAQLTEALNAYRVALSSVALAEKSLIQARENHRMTENQYRQGLATATELLDARFLLTRAEKEKITASYDAALSLARLEFLVGSPDAVRACGGGQEPPTSR